MVKKKLGYTQLVLTSFTYSTEFANTLTELPWNNCSCLHNSSTCNKKGGLESSHFQFRKNNRTSNWVDSIALKINSLVNQSAPAMSIDIFLFCPKTLDRSI